ncbi:MAG TPA: GDP-mannose 4,6-dehydratase [Thermomicrobiales bacterium]
MGTTERSVLITGGAGFIGVNLADRAIRAGHRVTLLDDLSRRGSEDNVGWLRSRHGDDFDLVVGSVADQRVCAKTVAEAEVVYHLAAQTAVTTSVTDPRSDFMVNALGTFNVLEGARCAGHNPILVYASTNKVYGGMEDVATVEQPTRHVFRDLPRGVDETRQLDFHSPYGCSKGAADQYVRDYARIYGLPTVVFRQSCVYGPRQMGVEDQGWVAWFIIALATGKPMTIYGDGKQVRDLLYVEDLLDAYERAVERIDVSRGQAYNMGGGAANAISIWWEFKPLVEAALDRLVPDPAFAPARPGDQPIFVADTTKAERELGWSPRVNVADGIQRLTEWVLDNRALFA